MISNVNGRRREGWSDGGSGRKEGMREKREKRRTSKEKESNFFVWAQARQTLAQVGRAQSERGSRDSLDDNHIYHYHHHLPSSCTGPQRILIGCLGGLEEAQTKAAANSFFLNPSFTANAHGQGRVDFLRVLFVRNSKGTLS